MGKSAKEPILVSRCFSREKFAGGILAVANHVANYCNEFYGAELASGRMTSAVASIPTVRTATIKMDGTATGTQGNKMQVDIESFKNIGFQKRTHCLVCEKPLDTPLIELPDLPITEVYTREPVRERVGFVDQGFQLCRNCGHGQLLNVIDMELVYESTFSYHFRTSESATASESSDFFIDFFNSVVERQRFNNIVEIGCNDLYVLKALRSRADRLVGIDPILKGREEESSEGNIVAVGDFFENVDLDEKPDVVLCKDTLEHVSDPKAFIRKTVDKAGDGTLFFFQFPLLERLLSGCRFDQVFHQHLNYFSLKSTIHMLSELGCELLDYKININHWGSILIAFRKGRNGSRYSADTRGITTPEILERYAVFKSNMDATNRRLNLLRNETIYGYGAALMLPVLSYHIGNDFSCLKCIIDDDKRKEGLYYINLPVSIRIREGIKDIADSVVLITAIFTMNNVRRILPRLFELNPRQILLPLNTI